MVYDEALAARIRRLLADRAGVRERKMFGGLAFLLHGNLCCGVIQCRLMLRVGADAYEVTLRAPHVRPMDFTGRPLRGFVYVDPAGLRASADLSRWVLRAVEFVSTLPPKASRDA